MVKKSETSKKRNNSSESIQTDIKPAVETLNFPPLTVIDKPEHHSEKPPAQNISDRSNIPPKKSGIDPLKITMIVVFGIIIVFWGLVLVLSIQISTGPKQVERNVTVIYYKPMNLSFEKLMSITDTTYSSNVSIIGYIGEESPNRYILDDFNNRITATIIDERLDAYSILFANNSKQVYNITGNYRYSSDRFSIEVNALTPIRKPLVEIKEKKLDNMTEGDKAGIKINLATGWVKIAQVII
ncbi:MAG: hypothetical protein ACP5NW_00700 [Candidatus Woesearchaeota archaeon]